MLRRNTTPDRHTTKDSDDADLKPPGVPNHATPPASVASSQHSRQRRHYSEDSVDAHSLLQPIRDESNHEPRSTLAPHSENDREQEEQDVDNTGDTGNSDNGVSHGIDDVPPTTLASTTSKRKGSRGMVSLVGGSSRRTEENEVAENNATRQAQRPQAFMSSLLRQEKPRPRLELASSFAERRQTTDDGLDSADVKASTASTTATATTTTTMRTASSVAATRGMLPPTDPRSASPFVDEPDNDDQTSTSMKQSIEDHAVKTLMATTGVARRSHGSTDNSHQHRHDQLQQSMSNSQTERDHHGGYGRRPEVPGLFSQRLARKEAEREASERVRNDRSSRNRDRNVDGMEESKREIDANDHDENYGSGNDQDLHSSIDSSSSNNNNNANRYVGTAGTSTTAPLATSSMPTSRRFQETLPGAYAHRGRAYGERPVWGRERSGISEASSQSTVLSAARWLWEAGPARMVRRRVSLPAPTSSLAMGREHYRDEEIGNDADLVDDSNHQLYELSYSNSHENGDSVGDVGGQVSGRSGRRHLRRGLPRAVRVSGIAVTSGGNQPADETDHPNTTDATSPQHLEPSMRGSVEARAATLIVPDKVVSEAQQRRTRKYVILGVSGSLVFFLFTISLLVFFLVSSALERSKRRADSDGMVDNNGNGGNGGTNSPGPVTIPTFPTDVSLSASNFCSGVSSQNFINTTVQPAVQCLCGMESLQGSLTVEQINSYDDIAQMVWTSASMLDQENPTFGGGTNTEFPLQGMANPIIDKTVCTPESTAIWWLSTSDDVYDDHHGDPDSPINRNDGNSTITNSTANSNPTGSTSSSVSAALNDVYNLVRLFVAWNGMSWTDTANWLTTIPPCSWEGVRCGDDGRVHELHLHQRGLTGNLNQDALRVGLSSLRHLNLNGNQLGGHLPTTLPTRTMRVDLSANRLEGTLPALWANLTELKHLNLSKNADLTGTIPAEWRSLVNLQHLDLSHTMVTDTVPVCNASTGLKVNCSAASCSCCIDCMLQRPTP